MNDINEELKRIDESYKNSFNKIDDINNISGNMNDLWAQSDMNNFAKKMGKFTEEMVKLQDVFKEYESEVKGITKVGEKLEDVYGKRK